MNLLSADLFKWMPSDGLWFTVIAAHHQLREKAFSNGTNKSLTRFCVCLSACVQVPVCEWGFAPTHTCLMAVASRVPSVSVCYAQD